MEESWWETTYVATHLWRHELLPAKYSFDAATKFELPRRMLGWYAEIDHHWSLKPGPKAGLEAATRCKPGRFSP